MKIFLRSIFFYLIIPLGILFMLIETFLYIYPNAFNQKSKYFHKNINDIELLILGSSHAQDGINPAYIDISAANVAYGGQGYEMDSALLYHYGDKMNSLKYLLVEIDYIDLYKLKEPDNFRYKWYYKFYDIKLNQHQNWLDKYSLYYSNPDFFNNYIRNIPFEKVEINKYGNTQIITKDKFDKMEYDSIQIANDPSSYMIPYVDNKINFNINLSRLESIKDFANDHHIEVVFITYPMYPTYYQKLQKDRTYSKWRNYLTNLNRQGYHLIDMERSDEFDVTDFANTSHLNIRGSEKLSKILNDYFQEYVLN